MRIKALTQDGDEEEVRLPVEGQAPSPASPRRDAKKIPMIVTTTATIEGKPIREYCGIVTGDAVLGANVFRDLFAGNRDIVGGRSITSI